MPSKETDPPKAVASGFATRFVVHASQDKNCRQYTQREIES